MSTWERSHCWEPLPYMTTCGHPLRMVSAPPPAPPSNADSAFQSAGHSALRKCRNLCFPNALFQPIFHINVSLILDCPPRGWNACSVPAQSTHNYISVAGTLRPGKLCKAPHSLDDLPPTSEKRTPVPPLKAPAALAGTK